MLSGLLLIGLLLGRLAGLLLALLPLTSLLLPGLLLPGLLLAVARLRYLIDRHLAKAVAPAVHLVTGYPRYLLV